MIEKKRSLILLMICFKKLEKLVNMIKKYSLILILFLLIPLKSQAFSVQNEQQMYIGCYQNSKQYLDQCLIFDGLTTKVSKYLEIFH